MRVHANNIGGPTRRMKKSKAGRKVIRKVFAIVHKETGEFPLNWGQLPIYFFKKDAEDNVPPGPYIIQPIDWMKFTRLLLSHPNPKAI